MSPRLHFVLYHLAAYLRGINVRTIRPWSHSYITSTNFNNFIVLIWYYVELTKIMKLFSHPVPLQYRRPMCMVPYLPASCFALHLVRFSDEIEGGRERCQRKEILSFPWASLPKCSLHNERAAPTVLPTDVHVPPISRSNITCGSDIIGRGCVNCAGRSACVLRNFPQRYLSHNLSRSTAEQMTQNEWSRNQLFHILSHCHSMKTNHSEAKPVKTFSISSSYIV